MITTFFVSYVYELVGRKLTIFFSFFTTAICFLLIPYTAPNLNYLIVVRCLIGVTMSAPYLNPLIPDYVKRQTQGRAVALNGIGLVIGEVFAMGVLFNITKSMTYKNAFKVTAGIIFLFSLILLIAVKDPNMKTIRTGPKHLEQASRRISEIQSR